MLERVLIAGVGALGSEVAKNVGLLGCKSVFLADADVIEERNIGRSVLTSEPRGIGQSKVEHALSKLRSWFPKTRWDGAAMEIADVDAAQFSKAQIIFSCVDSDLARTEMAALAARYLLPVADAGLGGTSTRVGRASWFPADHASACFACLLQPRRRAALLSLWESDVHACWAGDIALENTGWSTTPTMASMIAGLQVEVARRALETNDPSAFSLQLDLDRAASIERIRHRRGAGCPFHEDVPGELFPTCSVAECRECRHVSFPMRRIGWLRRWGSCAECGSRSLAVRESLRDEAARIAS